MNRRTFLISGLQLSSAVALAGSGTGKFFTYLQPDGNSFSSTDLRTLFLDPPKVARPLTLWHWMNGLISKEGITADLESFKAAGLAGVQVFLVGGSEMAIDDPKNQIMTDSWRELNKFAIKECARLGLDFGTHNSPGWSSTAYPTVTPQQSMQKVVCHQTLVSGGKQLKIELEVPKTNLDYYEDIAVYAVKNEFETVTLSNIVNLADKLTGNTLSWDVPAGNWTIFRLGHTPMGSKNGTAPLSGQGLEIDKLNPAALRDYWKTFPKKMIEDAGSEAGKSFVRFEIDSYEHGVQNWSTNFRQEFINRRGYDPTPFLLISEGKKVESVIHSERFRYDQRLTLRELFETNYFAEMQKLIHQVDGMELIIEPYSTGKEQPFETSNAAAWGDLLMCEFWQKPTTWGWDSVKPTSSAAHVWGKNLVAAEAFTGQPNSAWKVAPFTMKSTGDRAFAGGVNKLFFHSSAHQPWNNVFPGMTMGQWGTHFGRTQTWWAKGGQQWISYLSRCQYLLQAGIPVSDLLYLTYDRITPSPIEGYDCDTIGTNALLQRLKVKGNKLVLPNGVSYSALILPKGTKMLPALLEKVAEFVKSGATVIGAKPNASPSLENYPKCDDAVKSLADLVWGLDDQPHHTYGKGNVYQLPVKEALERIKLHPDLAVKSHSGKQPLLWIHRMLNTEQQLYFLSNQEDVTINAKVSFRVTGMIPEFWDAYSGKIENVVFANFGATATEVEITLPPSGSIFVAFLKKAKKTEFIKRFDKPSALSSVASTLVSEKGNFYLLAANKGKYFVETTKGKTTEVTVSSLPEVAILDKDWNLEFFHWGKPSEKLKLAKLVSWVELSDELKYFSGTVSYKTTFDSPSTNSASSLRYLLDLGEVENIVKIIVNGKQVSTLWAPPFVQDISEFVHSGINTLELEVTNLWANRLIGDEEYPDDLEWNKKSLAKIPEWVLDGTGRKGPGRQTFTTYKFFKKGDKLLPSGLLGPVSLRYFHYEKLNLS